MQILSRLQLLATHIQAAFMAYALAWGFNWLRLFAVSAVACNSLLLHRSHISEATPEQVRVTGV